MPWTEYKTFWDATGAYLSKWFARSNFPPVWASKLHSICEEPTPFEFHSLDCLSQCPLLPQRMMFWIAPSLGINGLLWVHLSKRLWFIFIIHNVQVTSPIHTNGWCCAYLPFVTVLEGMSGDMSNEFCSTAVECSDAVQVQTLNK